MERPPVWILHLGILPKLALSLAILGGLSVAGVALVFGASSSPGRLFVIVAVVWGLTTTLLLLVVHFHLVLPLRSLIGAAEALKAGDYSVPVRKVTLDETGRLADAFEGMRVEIRRAIESAEQSRQEWQATFDIIKDRIYLLGPDFTIRRVNRAALNAWGGSLDSLLGLPCRNVCTAGRSEECPAQRAILQRAPHSEEIRDSENGRALEFSAYPLFSEGRCVGLVEVARDVTEVRQALETAIRRESLRLLGEVAAGVAHDLNNLCAIVVGYASLAKKRLGDPLEVERALGFIMDAALTGGDTIRRIATFARLKQPSEERAPVELHALLDDVLALARPKWRDDALERGIEISVETELAAVPLVSANESGLKEVFLNLILNAIDAMPSGGTLSLRSYREEEWVAAEVTDTGAGMSEAVRARAFDPFFTTKGEKGTGLGLAIAHTVVEAHGGRIGIESRPGQGTTVRVWLPISEGAAVSAPTAEIPPLGALTVLVVEDQREVREFLVEILDSQGHTVIAAATGDEGLRKVVEGGVDLVVTDLAMPGLSGLDLARAVKERYPALPVLLVTGYADLLDESARLSVDAVLGKPFTQGQFFQAVAEAFRR